MRPSPWETGLRNVPLILDILLNGPSFQSVCQTIADFEPDVLLCDADICTLRAGLRLGVPRISFDHYGVLVYCRPDAAWIDRLSAGCDSFLYSRMAARPDRVIVSSFYEAPPRDDGVLVIPPILRDEVRRTRPRAGDHLLVYFSRGPAQYTPRMERMLRSYDGPVHLYGFDREGPDGNLRFLPLSNQPFVDDLAGCRAVVSTAGNQLVGECIHFGKPMLVSPECTVEQRLNARALEREGIGMQVPLGRVGPDVLRAFLARRDAYVRSIDRLRRDGRHAAVEAIERYCRELAGAAPAAAEVARETG
jgi:uncharacterized protein (TIGR00661 family)